LLGQKSSLTTSRLPWNARSILVDTIIKAKQSTSMKGARARTEVAEDRDVLENRPYNQRRESPGKSRAPQKDRLSALRRAYITNEKGTTVANSAVNPFLAMPLSCASRPNRKPTPTRTRIQFSKNDALLYASCPSNLETCRYLLWRLSNAAAHGGIL